jgi:hypothetical protein
MDGHEEEGRRDHREKSESDQKEKERSRDQETDRLVVLEVTRKQSSRSDQDKSRAEMIMESESPFTLPLSPPEHAYLQD